VSHNSSVGLRSRTAIHEGQWRQESADWLGLKLAAVSVIVLAAIDTNGS
jgi:hypothetical protein